ncbi:MAG: methylmalonyl Co-A mutase-associated GTPase MeaB, partial [Acidobacteria bacterium]|nr:methylmalonyl Co-A mutase-associated GTPase MeaB [Acidobacteriota bacterium]
MGRAIPPLALVQPVLDGRLSAVARMITHAESGEEACQEALAEIYRHTGKAHVVGITGVPGSGKSALVTRLCKALRAGERSVGVIAIDPSSPFSGGSILGDRIRMNEL